MQKMHSWLVRGSMLVVAAFACVSSAYATDTSSISALDASSAATAAIAVGLGVLALIVGIQVAKRAFFAAGGKGR